MEKDKYDFIMELLENKKLKPAQIDRLLFLTKLELRNDFNGFKKFEKKNVTLSNGSPSQNEKENYADLPQYFNPSNLYKYLLDYNQNSILKSTCHEIDSNELDNILKYSQCTKYDFEKHLEKVLEEFLEHDKKPAPHQIKAIVRGYLTGKNFEGKAIKGWSTNEISVNWSCSEIRNWAQSNQNIPPNIDEGLMEQLEKTGYEIQPPLFIRSGTFIQTFSDLVLYFKRLFHVKNDNSLKSIIESENKEKGWEKRIDFFIDEFTFPKNIEFFTDVDKLVQAYNRVIELIIEQIKSQESSKNKPIVELTLTEKHNSIEFSILHRNSVYGKTVINTVERLGTKYRELIKNQINGLCNFYIQADFENKESYRIGIWDKTDLWKYQKPVQIRLAKKIGGVEHIFEIIKPPK